MDDLTRRLLELEGRFYKHGGRKVRAIYDELQLSPTIYAMKLSEAADDPEACLAFPTVTARVRRRREAGLRVRSARRAG